MLTELHFLSERLENERYNYEILLLLGVFIIIEWFSRNKVEPISGRYSLLKLSFCILSILLLGLFSNYKEFIYFQF